MAEYGGALRDVSALELGALAARAAIEQSKFESTDFDHAIFGNALQTSGDALYGARHVALKAGLPIAEALSLGVPVICSDLPELREVGRLAPEFLSPHNDEVWYRAISDYAQFCSERRTRQLGRIAHWRPVSWEEHFAITMPLLA